MRPEALAVPPGTDPREAAVESFTWGDEFSCYLVRAGEHWHVWIIRPFDDGEQVYPFADEGAARGFLAAEKARMLLGTSWGERVAAVTTGHEVSGRILFAAEVLNGAEDGIWLAVQEAGRTGAEDDVYTLQGFADLGAAVEAFAARADAAASQIGGAGPSGAGPSGAGPSGAGPGGAGLGWPEVAAADLRYRAAYARAGAARAALGDIIRASRERIRAERAVSRVAGTAGVSREFLYHVMAGDDWTWKGLMPARKNAPPPRGRDQDRDTGQAGRGTGWTAWIRFAVAAPGESEARAVAARALAQMSVTPAVPPAAAPAGDGCWTVTTVLDLAGTSFDPDTVGTRLSYLTGRVPDGVTWVRREQERQGTCEWPPNFWDRRPGADDQLMDPAIKAAIIHASAPGER